tara:strand:- start:547 stop:825 length:279 start_codon:yes stop_codon:yes gene_type:complete
MQPYILIEPINYGELQEKRANAIAWNINNLIRGANMAIATCYLMWEENGNTVQNELFTVEIDNTTLQSWGSDDTVIDDVVLAYSPLFIRRNP